ncbi:MAG TPA: DUF5691 domain-containing protein, partial [Roseiflexaceae bacterium]
AAGVRLLEILIDRPDVLAEWLKLAVARGGRVPHAYLPDLLDHAADCDGKIQDLVVEVGGERLAWLAGLDAESEWRFAAHLDAREALTFGNRELRTRALRRLRKQDPAQARALLIEALANETGEARGQLLATLEIGLAADDEPLLEEALGDSRREARQVALRLIRALPASRFGQRWAARARGVIDIKKSRLGTKLQIHPPAPAEPTWIADGLDPRPPKDVGEKAWLLQQVLALAPPSSWPISIIDAVQSSDWAQPALAGLGQAAAAYRDADWTEALLLTWARATLKREIAPLNASALFQSLAAARAEIVLRRLLDTAPAAAPPLATDWQQLWSPEFSRYFIGRLPALLQAWEYAATGVLRPASLCLDPCVLPEAEQVLAGLPEGVWTRMSMDRLVRMLEFRRALRSELA